MAGDSHCSRRPETQKQRGVAATDGVVARSERTAVTHPAWRQSLYHQVWQEKTEKGPKEAVATQEQRPQC